MQHPPGNTPTPFYRDLGPGFPLMLNRIWASLLPGASFPPEPQPVARSSRGVEQLVPSVTGPGSTPTKAPLGSTTLGDLPGAVGAVAGQSDASPPWAGAGRGGRFMHFRCVCVAPFIIGLCPGPPVKPASAGFGGGQRRQPTYTMPPFSSGRFGPEDPEMQGHQEEQGRS